MKRARGFAILLCLLAGGILGWWIHHQRPQTRSDPATLIPTPTGPADPPPLQEASPLSLTSSWVKAAPGADYWVREAAGGRARIAAVRVDLDKCRVEVADLTHDGKTPQTVRSLAAERGAVAAINGGYFDEHWHPLGVLIHEGKQTNPPFKKAGGYFCVVQGRAMIRPTEQGLPAGVTEALQCHPRLVTGGQVVSRFKPGKHVRAAVGVTEAGEVILAVTCQGELSLRDWARAMKALGCQDALNLDGGPSSQLYFHAGETELDLPGAYGIPSALVVLPK